MEEKSPREIVVAQLKRNAARRAARQEFQALVAKWHVWRGPRKPQG